MINPDAIIQINKGLHNSFDFVLAIEGTNTPLALTGYTLDATFRERGNTAQLLRIPMGTQLSIVDALEGRINLVISGNDSLLLPSRDWTLTTYQDLVYTCWCQIDGFVGGLRYNLVTLAIDNISTTHAGGL